MACWSNLPTVILAEIMSYLSKRDILACSTVCKHWCEVVDDPVIWNNLIISLDNDITVFVNSTDPMTFKLVKRYASYVKSLEITWSQPYLPRRWIKNRIATVAHDTSTFLLFLKTCNIQLTTIKINDWYFTAKYKKVIHTLCSLLKFQRNLKNVDLSNIYLSKREVVKILRGCDNSRFNVKHINLLSSFQEWHSLIEHPPFVYILQRFHNLEVLKIDYTSLTDYYLCAICSRGNGRLKHLEIHVKDAETRSHILTAETWQKLTLVCTSLKVTLHIYNICHHGNIYYILMESMPLHTFVLQCANVWDMNRSRYYCGTLSLLLRNYESTLTHVCLILKNNRENLDDYLYEMIDRCKNLEYLEFDGVLRNINFLRKVCVWQNENIDSVFKFLQVRPKNTSFNNNLIISDIWRSHVRELKEKSFSFEIETFNNPTVRIFC